MAEPTTPEDVLLAAADAIAEHGHIKGSYGGERQGFCAMGAMRHAVVGTHGLFYTSTAHRPGLQALYDSAQLLLGDSLSSGLDAFNAIARFNDAPETTGEDVILALKKAAHHDG